MLARHGDAHPRGQPDRAERQERGAHRSRARAPPRSRDRFDSAGWGLSARVLAQRNEDRAFVETLGPLKELYRDHAVYAGAFLKTFLESYVIDDKLHVDAVLDGEAVELSGLTDLIVKKEWPASPRVRIDVEKRGLRLIVPAR